MDSLILLLLFQVGDKVQKGQVVCIIEAMKLMNEIEVCVHCPFYDSFAYYSTYHSLFTNIITILICFPLYSCPSIV